MRILIVEDDKSINNLIKESLEFHGFDVTCTFNGLQAMESISQSKMSLAIVDLMLPDYNGLDLMKYFKNASIPVIIVSAIIDIESISKGLELGADDYLTKPFDVTELIARVKALIRRVYHETELIRYQSMIVNLASKTMMIKNQEVALTSKEFDLLVLFLNNTGIVLSRTYLYETVWGDDLTYESRTLDLHVQRLRKKAHLESKLISVYKSGYKLV